MYTSRTNTLAKATSAAGSSKKKTAEQKIIISRHVLLRFFPLFVASRACISPIDILYLGKSI